MTIRRAFFVSLLLAACRPTPAQDGAGGVKATESIAVPPRAALTPVPDNRVAYYKRAFPNATAFYRRDIPKEMIRPFDDGNNAYVEAHSAKNEVLGYLRDFTGAVSPKDNCPCNPLNLTLIFDAQKTFTDLIAPAPLQKKDHAELTPAEQAQLVRILKNPGEALMGTKSVEDVVDAVTGATKRELEGQVVKWAGLSTRRILGWVADTTQVLRGVPMMQDKARLDSIMAQATTPSAQSRALLTFLSSAESPEVKQYAYRVATQNILSQATTDKAYDATLESMLFAPPLDPDMLANELAGFCYRMTSVPLLASAQSGEAKSAAERCAASVPPDAVGPEARAQRFRLQGTLAFLANKPEKAIEYFAEAAPTITADIDPAMYNSWLQALAATGDKAGACTKARVLYIQTPLLDGVKDALRYCGDAAREVATLDAGIRQHLLSTRLKGDTAVPTLNLESLKVEPVELKLGAQNKITVLVFFATWCPHCQAEMPRLVKFAESLKAGPLKDRVQLVAVRTSVERETESYESFAAKFKPNFTVYTDATMSLTFSAFAKHAGVTPGLPTVAVVDAKGVLRYLINRGDYSDTVKELTWACESLLGGS